jgi:hypothetical protein
VALGESYSSADCVFGVIIGLGFCVHQRPPLHPTVIATRRQVHFALSSESLTAARAD